MVNFRLQVFYFYLFIYFFFFSVFYFFIFFPTFDFLKYEIGIKWKYEHGNVILYSLQLCSLVPVPVENVKI